MRNNGFFVFATCCLLVFSATSCQKIKGIFGKKKSSTTGWTYNDSKNGGIEYNNVKAQKTGPGLVFIPGGTFVMGRTQEDVMGDWNNTPKRVSIASFYMDETEVRNIDWLEYLTWLRTGIYHLSRSNTKRHYPIPWCGVTSWVTTNRW